MQLGFDGKRAIQNFTGLGNYSRHVLNALTRFFPENSYKVYTAKVPGKEHCNNLPDVEFKHPEKKKFAGLWRTFSIVKDLKRDKIEVYHGLSNEIPVSLAAADIASVVTIHDLIFLKFPQYYAFIDRQIYTYKFKYACRHANVVVAVSEQTKRDIIHYFKVPEEKIRVVYQGCDPSFEEKKPEADLVRIRSAYNLPEKFLLNVGTVEPRKNLMLIARALKSVPEDVHLVVIGKQTAYADEVKKYIDAAGLNDRVRFLKNVPFTDLPGIYQMSEIFIYPSRYEGFGIPIVEALHSGVPVIAATGSCLEEAGGPDSKYINPDKESELVDTINHLLSNRDLCETMIVKGLDYAKRFNSRQLASELNDIYRQLIGKYDRRD